MVPPSLDCDRYEHGCLKDEAIFDLTRARFLSIFWQEAGSQPKYQDRIFSSIPLDPTSCRLEHRVVQPATIT
jgi:hypothetical protein